MATIAENLQTIKEAVENIKQAIIAKGGTVSGDLTTYANAIESLALGGGNSVPDYIVISSVPNTGNAEVYQFLKTLIENKDETARFGYNRMDFYLSDDVIILSERQNTGGELYLYRDGKTILNADSGGAD
jgi:hypothetical protein